VGLELRCVDAFTGSTCPVSLQRSKTTLAVTEARPHGYVDLERQARSDAERAMKVCALCLNDLFTFADF